uniref:Uncharacterized protein n=1 Tax=Oryza brachyantha TaxID=4533 RepID=J3MJH8_ORYBR
MTTVASRHIILPSPSNHDEGGGSSSSTVIESITLLSCAKNLEAVVKNFPIFLLTEITSMIKGPKTNITRDDSSGTKML